jgi:hypothetical protein
MHIVRAPAPPGQGGDPPKKKQHKGPPRSLTDGEAMRLAAALRHLRALYGGWDVLASVMGVSPAGLSAVSRGRHRPGLNLARKAALAAGKSLETMISGPVDASKCPTCGAVRGAS